MMKESPESNTKYKDGVNRNARLIVRNIPFKATEESLKEHFSRFGSVEEVKLLRKPDGKLVGCGFVHFTHVPMANAALAATHKKPFLDRPLSVAWAVPKHKYGEKEQNEDPERNVKHPKKEATDKVVEIIDEDTEEGGNKQKNKTRVNRNARLIIRNVSFKATEESLKEHFQPYGEILEVKLLKKPDGKLVGCAFVHFKNVPMAKKALLNTNMKAFLGRPISVDWAVAKDKYMQHIVNQQVDMESEVKKEESDSDDDGPPLNISNDDLKQEVESESDDDSDYEDKKDVKAGDDESEDSDKESDDDDEDEDDEDDDEEDDEQDDAQGQTSTPAERKRTQLNDAEDGLTVFLTNIPFSVDDHQLRQFVEKTAPVSYALVCVDRLTEHSKGSGFVKFTNQDDADKFLALPADQLKLEGQLLQAKPALNRDNLQKASDKKQPKDNRNLYLVKEGVVVAGTKAAEGVSTSDMAKRLALERSKTQMLKNLNSADEQFTGRGRGRGQGRGQDPIASTSGYQTVAAGSVGGTTSETNQEALAQVRAQRQLTKSHRNSLSAAARQELLNRKRKAELHRVLLPDAPPRKRRAQHPSPERHACEFVAQGSETTIRHDAAEPALEVVADVTERVSEPEIIIELIDETISLAAGPSQNVIEVANPDFDSTLTDWLDRLQTQDSDDEDFNDINDIVDGVPFMTVAMTQPRTATDQIADNTGLSANETQFIRHEEETSDCHVRELVSSNDYYNFNWSDNRQTFKGKREVFTGVPGPTFPITDKTRPVDIFYKMFDTDFIDMLVTETNRYAEQKVSVAKLNATQKSARALRWKPTDRDEMVAFLAIMMLQGLYPKVKEEAYFLFDGFGTTPYFGSIMSYNRYNLLKTFQHFVNNDATTDMTKLNKIRPVIDYLNDKFSSLYKPAQEIAIDESLLKWHGRLSFAQKITTKAAQVGVKTYELCESSTGYLWRFIVYTGKDGGNRTNRQDIPDDHEEGSRNREQDRSNDGQDRSDDGQDSSNDIQDRSNDADDRPDNRQNEPDHDRIDDGSREVRPSSATAKIVYDLIEPLLHKGHTLIMDNFYNSPLLARCLKRDGQTDVYGTLRLSREFVPESIKTMTKSDIRQGEVVATYCSDLAVMLWRDANLVSMLSTYHHLQIGTRDKYNRLIYKPAIVLDYNKSMGGVDRKDQFLAAQPLERHRNKVWYKKLFRRLFNAALFNCFVIFTSSHIHKLQHRQFRTILSEDLLKIHRRIDLSLEPRLITQQPRATKTTAMTTTATTTTDTRTTAKSTMTVARRQTRPYVEGNHFPASTGSRATRCWLCQSNKRQARTAYKCAECNVNLCILGCFRDYHKPPST